MTAPAAAPSLARPHAMLTPYRGLMPYSEDDWRFFFGREHECEVIGANLMASRLTLLYGSSGVGKTSVLRAGVAHQLTEQARQNVRTTGSPEHVVAVFSSWRTEPVAALLSQVASAVSDTLRGMPVGPPPSAPGLVAALEEWAERIRGELLIVLDQFEEYFLYHPHDEPGDFADQLAVAIRRPGLRVNFLISLREDTLARLDRFKGRIPNLFDNYLRLELLERDAAQAAIELPIQEYNRTSQDARGPVSIEPELVQAVLDQIAAEAEQAHGGDHAWSPAAGATRIDPSYLQVVMDRVWAAETRAGGRVLRRETLNRLGSAREILATYLDQTMTALTPERQDVAAAVFHHLVTPSGMKIAHTVHDLAQYTSYSDEAVQDVVLLLSGDLRILRSVAAPGDFSQPRYEIYHDRLADAVLGWRTRHLAARQADLAARQLEEQRATAELRLQEAVVAEKLQADERVARERVAAVRYGRRRVLLPILLVFVTWLGFLVGGVVFCALIVHWLEKATWRRAFLIGLVWPVVGFFAATLGVIINILVYVIAVSVFGVPETLPQLALVAGLLAYSVGYAVHAILAGRITYILLNDKQRAEMLGRHKRLVMSVALVAVTWIGVIGVGLGAVIAPMLVVHAREQPVTWRRSFVIGVVWGLAGLLAFGVGWSVNAGLYLIGEQQLGLPETDDLLAFMAGFVANVVGYVVHALVGGKVTYWLIDDAHQAADVAAFDASAELNGHTAGEAKLGLELEQAVPKLAGNSADR